MKVLGRRACNTAVASSRTNVVWFGARNRNDERWLGFSTRNTGGECGERGHEICEICEKVMEEHTFF